MRTAGDRPSIEAAPPDPLSAAFAGLLGLLLGVGMLKFGNPVILDHLVETPRGLDEWRVFAWPLRIAYAGLVGVGLLGLALVVRQGVRSPCPHWLPGLLAAWLGWQVLATMTSIDPPLSKTILAHFIACAACFTLGHLGLGPMRETRVFWLCLVLGFVGVLGTAFEQHFGGLAATRKMILESRDAAQLPAEYLARIQSNRVFSTLVYPNALAGALLLLLPPTVFLAWRAGNEKLRGRRGGRVVAGVVLAAGLAVMVWSGSKAGWLLTMAVTGLVLFHLPWPRRWKVTAVTSLTLLGLTGFGFVYAEKLRRGPTSVIARVDYWSAALKGFAERPVLGQGPGAFKRVYGRVKRPESEMAQLAHNDYLQQATDSGVPGFALYTGFVIASLVWLYRRRPTTGDGLLAAVWLGLVAWFSQGLVEFGLYIPATAWTAFALLGWLLGQAQNPVPKGT